MYLSQFGPDILSARLRKKKNSNEAKIPFQMQANKYHAARLGSSMFLTEFDFGYDNGTNHDAALKTIQTADAKLQSWMGYSYKSYVPKTGNSPGMIWCQ